jgi:hypothetical protein
MRSDPVLKKWYRKINKKFFDNQLTNSVCVRWSNDEDKDDDGRCEEKYNGWCMLDEEGKFEYIIVVSDRLRKDKSLCTKVHTIVHEMCHVATKLRDQHGPAFEECRQFLADRGIFKKGALIKGLTIF